MCDEGSNVNVTEHAIVIKVLVRFLAALYNVLTSKCYNISGHYFQTSISGKTQQCH